MFFALCTSLDYHTLILCTACQAPPVSQQKAELGKDQLHGGVLTGFRCLILAVSQQLKDVHLHFGFPHPLGRTVDAVLGQRDGEPLPSAALHGVIQDGSCGSKGDGRDYAWQGPGSALHTSQPHHSLPFGISSATQAATASALVLLLEHPPSVVRPFLPLRPPSRSCQTCGCSNLCSSGCYLLLHCSTTHPPTLLGTWWCLTPTAAQTDALKRDIHPCSPTQPRSMHCLTS